MWSRRACLLVGLLVAAGCGQTTAQALDELRPRYAARRTQLRSLGLGLLQPGGAQAPALAALTPPLVFDEAREEASNTEMFMVEQLLDPDANLRAQELPDLQGSARLGRCLRWTGDRNPMSADALRRRDGARVRAQCEAALAQPWLIVLRTLAYRAPRAEGTTAHTPGLLELEGFVVDLATNAVRGTFRARGTSAPRVAFTHRSNESPLAALERAAYASLWEVTRAEVAAALRASGATVTLRR